MIEFQDVSFSYEDTPILKGITLTVQKGDFTAVLGANGAGKTTLIKLLNGLLKPTSGTVRVKGLDTKTTKTSEYAKFVGFLFQNPDRQICQTTIREEISFGLRCVTKDEAEIKRRCDEMLQLFAFDGAKDPFSISRGERQRVALASLLALKPELLILDEPTTGLDYKECMQIMGIVKELNEQGTTVIMVSHDMELVADFAKRLLVVKDGELVADDTMERVMYDRELVQKSSLLPPQIVGLAMELGQEYHGIFSMEEMAERIEGRLAQ